MFRKELKARAIQLRQRGATYSEIKKFLKTDVSKSTLSCWFRDLKLDPNVAQELDARIKRSLETARLISQNNRRVRRKEYLGSLLKQNSGLKALLKNKNTAKIALAMLYLGEGSKSPKRGSLVFGNSDPAVIGLFLHLLRYCYDIDERKFRCTVQCRADQDHEQLETFWAFVTKISPRQFYPARVDPRTVGKKSKKPNYKGVCRVDYFSAHIFNDLLKAIEVIIAGR